MWMVSYSTTSSVFYFNSLYNLEDFVCFSHYSIPSTIRSLNKYLLNINYGPGSKLEIPTLVFLWSPFSPYLLAWPSVLTLQFGSLQADVIPKIGLLLVQELLWCCLGKGLLLPQNPVTHQGHAAGTAQLEFQPFTPSVNIPMQVQPVWVYRAAPPPEN